MPLPLPSTPETAFLTQRLQSVSCVTLGQEEAHLGHHHVLILGECLERILETPPRTLPILHIHAGEYRIHNNGLMKSRGHLPARLQTLGQGALQDTTCLRGSIQGAEGFCKVKAGQESPVGDHTVGCVPPINHVQQLTTAAFGLAMVIQRQSNESLQQEDSLQNGGNLCLVDFASLVPQQQVSSIHQAARGKGEAHLSLKAWKVHICGHREVCCGCC